MRVLILALALSLNAYGAQYKIGDTPKFKRTHHKSKWFKCKSIKIVDTITRPMKGGFIFRMEFLNDKDIEKIDFHTVLFSVCEGENFIEDFTQYELK